MTGRALLLVYLVYLLPRAPVPVAGQLDGSFWWMNADLLKKAESLRETKDVKAIVVSKDTALDEVRVGGNSIVESDSPDCICVSLERCRSGALGRDGLCGSGRVCCRGSQIIVLASTTPSSTSPAPTVSTTASSTKLEPVDSLIFDSNSAPNPLPETIPYRPVPLNETEYDPNLLLELSNLLLSHSLPDAIQPIDNNALPSGQTATNKSQCGRRQHSVTSRIFFQDDDGATVSQLSSGAVGFSEFPWTVAVYQLIRNGSFVYHCGGAMLNSTVVITAAHCVSNNRLHPNRFKVHAGDWDLRHTQERIPHQERTVQRIEIHPNYYSGALFNDVALLFFGEPFNDAASNIEPVCLPGPDDVFTYDSCFVTGWGGSPKSNRIQSIQQFSRMSAVDRQQCEIRLQSQPSLGRKFKLHDSFICAEGNGTDACQGSGGSPFVCERNGRYFLLGVISWGIGCGDGIPAVLANVGGFSEWVRAQ